MTFPVAPGRADCVAAPQLWRYEGRACALAGEVDADCERECPLLPYQAWLPPGWKVRDLVELAALAGVV